MVETDSLLKMAAPLGIGGIIAVIIFLFYRKDILSKLGTSESQSALILQVVKENTAAITLNTATINVLHQRLDGELTHHRVDDRLRT